MPIQLIDNAHQSLAASLAAQLAHANQALIHVAYLRQSGLAVLETELQEFLGRGGTLRLLCGADFGLTEPEAIRQLLSWNAQVRLHISRNIAGFHPKSYLLLGPDGAAPIIGSSNFTRGGLVDNVESNLVAATIYISKSKTWNVGIRLAARYIKND